MALIKQVYNNNIVLAVDANGDEVVYAGAGVGFGAKRGDEVDPQSVERVFEKTGITSSGAFRILLELPPHVLALVSDISAALKNEFGIGLTGASEVALADHLTQALMRKEEGSSLANSMLWETKATYPDEFVAALRVLELIEQKRGIRLPVEEAGFIAMHLANATSTQRSERSLALARALRTVVAIVNEELDVRVDGRTRSGVRFLTHIKFVVARLTENQSYEGGFSAAFKDLKKKEPKAYATALKISKYLSDEFGAALSEEEHFYITIHLHRLLHDVRQESASQTLAESRVSAHHEGKLEG